MDVSIETPPKEENPPTEGPAAEISFTGSTGRRCSLNNPRLLFTAIISIIMLLCGVILLAVPNVSDKAQNIGMIMISMVIGLWGGGLIQPLQTKPK